MGLSKTQKVWTSIATVVVVAGVAVGGYFGYPAYQDRHPNLLTTQQIKQNLGIKLSNQFTAAQDVANQTYDAALKNKQYTVDNMYSKVNPYGTSPLSALVIFQTDKPATVSYTVAGKDDATAISNTVAGNTKQHKVPVVGLYAGQANDVTLHIKMTDGQTIDKQIELTTAALPKTVADVKIDVKTSQPAKMALADNGVTVVARTTKEPLAIDANGDIRWFSTSYNEHIFKTLQNGHLLMMRKQNNSELVYNDLIETDYLGRIYRTYHFGSKTSGSENLTMTKKSQGETTVVHHDVIEMPNGNLLATVSDGSKYLEDTLVEIQRQTGKVVRIIDLKRLFPATTFTQYDATSRADKAIDWLHNNSLDYDQTDNGLIISSRHQDLVMKFNYKTLKPIWILSSKPKQDWPKDWQPYVLRYAKGTAINGGQHDAKLIPGSHHGDQETLTMYDNNYAVSYGDKKHSKQYSQGLQLQINTKTMTAKQTWAYGKQLGAANFTDRIGSTTKQANGNYLMDYGYLNAEKGDASNIIEVTPANQEVFNVKLTNLQNKGYVYRAYRVNLK